MGCGGAKTAHQAINPDNQPVSIRPANPHSSLPPEVMLGFDNILKSCSTPKLSKPAEQPHVPNPVKSDGLQSPLDQVKTGHDITPMSPNAKETDIDRKPLKFPAVEVDHHISSVGEPEPNASLSFKTDKGADGRKSEIPATHEERDSLNGKEPGSTAIQNVKTIPDPTTEAQPIEKLPMLNALYEDVPVTNPYLELIKTQREGKVEQTPAQTQDDSAPPDAPKFAFSEEPANVML